MGVTRTRNWAFCVYPESAPDNWLELLREQLVPGFVSPLHCDDVNADGESKKPHWHVLLMFKGPKTAEQVTEVSDALNATIPIQVKDAVAYARYLCHLDNPEKAPYAPSDVQCLCGTDYLEKVATAADVDSIIDEMEDWVDEQGVFSYAALCRYARTHRPDWKRVLRSRVTLHMTAYMKSCQWEVDHEV